MGALVLERGHRVRLADQLYGQIFEQIGKVLKEVA